MWHRFTNHQYQLHFSFYRLRLPIKRRTKKSSIWKQQLTEVFNKNHMSQKVFVFFFYCWIGFVDFSFICVAFWCWLKNINCLQLRSRFFFFNSIVKISLFTIWAYEILELKRRQRIKQQRQQEKSIFDYLSMERLFGGICQWNSMYTSTRKFTK